MTIVELNNLIRKTDNYTFAQSIPSFTKSEIENINNRISDVLEKEYKKIQESEDSDLHAAYGKIMDLAEKSMLLDLTPLGRPKTIEYAGRAVDDYAVDWTTKFDENELEVDVYTVNCLLGFVASKIEEIKSLSGDQKATEIVRCKEYVQTCKMHALENLPYRRDDVMFEHSYKGNKPAADYYRVLYNTFITELELYYDHALKCLDEI